MQEESLPSAFKEPMESNAKKKGTRTDEELVPNNLLHLWDGSTLRPGDYAYAFGSDEAMRELMNQEEIEDENDEDHVAGCECLICGVGNVEGEDDEDNPVLECDECQGGFHLKCLNPPLDAVPEVRACLH